MRARMLAMVALAACRPPGYGKESDVDAGGPDAELAIDAAVSDAAAIDAGPDAAPVTCTKTFTLEGRASATSVWVSGDFVGWAGNPDDGAIALALGGDGVWSGNRTFAAGVYQYKLVVDSSEWITDPSNPETITDENGNTNSVYRCP
jgi:hypothetical protein